VKISLNHFGWWLPIDWELLLPGSILWLSLSSHCCEKSSARSISICCSGDLRRFHCSGIPPPLRQLYEHFNAHRGHRQECIRRLHVGGVGTTQTIQGTHKPVVHHIDNNSLIHAGLKDQITEKQFCSHWIMVYFTIGSGDPGDFMCHDVQHSIFVLDHILSLYPGNRRGPGEASKIHFCMELNGN
jgi:hypothetical protein